MIANWKEICEDGNTIIAVFLDLKRAFETIDRSRLLMKLKATGFQPRVMKWFESYLHNRSQRTIVNGHISDPVRNDLGVPQGSV